MAESEQNFAGEEYEPQAIEGTELEQQIMTGNGAEQQDAGVHDYEPQNFDTEEPQSFDADEVGQQHFTGSDIEHFDANEPEKNDPSVVPEHNYAEIESEHNLSENEIKQTSLENESKQEFSGNDQDEIKEDDDILRPEEGHEHANNLEVDNEDKKWPGWPGESVFRMLVPAQKVGNIIGRKGEYIKKIVEETRARIKILDGPPGTAERAVLFAFLMATHQSPLWSQTVKLHGCRSKRWVFSFAYAETFVYRRTSLSMFSTIEMLKNFAKAEVMVSAKEEPDSSLPPAIDGLLRVHKRIVDGLESDSAQAPTAAGAKVSTRLLVPATQAGSLIGKQGATVKSIQETSNCIVRVLGSEDLPVFALQDDRVVEVVGEPAAVHKAIELVAAQLRKFLVDRTVIPLFEMQMQNPNTRNHMDHMPPHQPSWGPPHGLPSNAGGVPGYGPGPQYMPPQRQMDNYYTPPDMAPPAERQPHHGISTYGREAPIGGQASSNSQAAPSMITQVTQHMQIPLSYADAVIGASGSSISYIRRASGATVTIQETRGAPGEMTVEINGTASQVQAAQQLIQNFMAGAGAPSQTQSAASTDQSYNQGYSSYAAAPASTYGSTPASSGYASQAGAYGSAYGSSYGY